jgi:rhodanese-related sulfurtransferase
MKLERCIGVVIVLMLFFVGTPSFAKDVTFTYPVKIEGHKGGDLNPTEAYKKAMNDEHVFIVDVRTRPEYVLVGHPTNAYHVPVRFWTGNHTAKGYGMVINDHFGEDLKKMFNPETDTLIFMCRSGGRSCQATELAAASGWPTDKIYNMMGGFEGDKVKDVHSAFNGKRKMGGWKNEGLPWTYKIDAPLAYPEAS